MALIAHWKLDDNAASTTVVATVGSNATLGGGDNTDAKRVEGPGGGIPYGMLMNGTDDYIDISAMGLSFATTVPFSVSLWFKQTNAPPVGGLGNSASSSNDNFQLLSANTVRFRINSTVSFTVPPPGGGWNHILATKDSSNNGRIFINGVESTSGAQGLGTSTMDFDRACGNFSTAYFGAAYAQIKVFDTDESANVATLYAEGPDGPRVEAVDGVGGLTTSPIAHTIPAGWAADDLVLAVMNTHIRSVTSAPSGWTLVDTEAQGGTNYHIYRKILEAGDLGASQSWTLDGNPTSAFIYFIRISGADGTNPINDWDVAASVTTTTHTCPSVDTTEDNCLLLHIFPSATASIQNIAGSGAEVYNNATQKFYAQIKPVAGATGTGTYTTGINRSYLFYTIAITPGEGGGGGGVVIPVFRHHYRQMKF